MATKLFVGSLPYSVTDDDLADMFKDFGTVQSAKVIFDRETNRSKGFGFVEFETAEEAKAAIDALNNQDVQGRKIIVNEARPQEERPRRDFGGDRGQGGGYNRNRF
jgi:cold-inducible RNA-binding protein